MTIRDAIPLGVAALALFAASACGLQGCDAGSTAAMVVTGGLFAGTWLFLRLVGDPSSGSRRDNPGYRGVIDWYRSRLAWLAVGLLAMGLATFVFAWVTSS